MRQKKNLKILKSFVGMVAAGTLMHGCVSPKTTKNPSVRSYAAAYQALVQQGTEEEKATLNDLVNKYAEHSPSAVKLFDEILACSPAILFTDAAPDEDGSVNAGEGDDEELILNMNADVRAVQPLASTFWHEGEHVVHLSTAHKMGINAASFASVDDVFCYNALIEALANRKDALIEAETELYPMRSKDRVLALSKADEVFVHTLTGENRDLPVQEAYAKQAMLLANCETNILDNQIYFPENPNWNEIVTLLSRGEVTNVPVMPTPTLSFMNACLWHELQKHPNAKSLDEFDLSCTLAHQSVLGKDEQAVKRMIADMLLEVFQTMPRDAELSPETYNPMFYWMGFPTLEQQALIDRGESDFDTIRDANLAEFTTRDMFEMAENLIESPEIQALNTETSKYYGRMLHFSKQILCPTKHPSVRAQQNIR